MSAEGVTGDAQHRFEEPTSRYPKPRLVRKSEQVPLSISLPGLAAAANSRVWHKGVRTERSFARRLTFPPGGGTPIHTVTCDHVVVQMEGMIEFVMDGCVFALEPGDLLYFPANMLYEIHNRSEADAVFVSVGVEAEFGWPPRSNYWREPECGE